MCDYKTVTVLVVVFMVLLTPSVPAKQFIHNGEIEVLFPFEDDLVGALDKELAQAKTEVLVFAYSFTHKKIAAQLIGLYRRGIVVRVVADKSRKKEKNNQMEHLRRQGIEVIYGPARRAWHNKVIILDGHTVITGSANFTRSAQRYNRENMIIIRNNPPIAAHYRAYWQKLAGKK